MNEEEEEEEEEEEAYRSGGIEWVTHGYAMPTMGNQRKECARACMRLKLLSFLTLLHT